jgi:lipoprotein-anchoring transpeptidase ErfK/SrfK
VNQPPKRAGGSRLQLRGLLCIAAGLVLVLPLVTSCGGAPASEGSAQPYHAAPIGFRKPAVHLSCTPALDSRSTRSYAAVVRKLAVVRARPGGGKVVGRFGATDQNDYPTVFGIVGKRVDRQCKATWYHVQLPIKPNGSTGWVRAGAVRTYAIATKVVVHLSTRRLIAYHAGKPVLRAPVAVGSPQSPTPVGRFYINERFILTNPNGPFGVAALGISAHSNVLTNWVQGGPIALHGTDEPLSIGHADSHGCVRLSNADMQRLLPFAPAGTPVLIRP